MNATRSALLLSAVLCFACGGKSSDKDGGAGGGSGGFAGGGSGGEAGGGAGGGGGAGADCQNQAATCASFGAQCGQGQLACGTIDCQTCAITTVFQSPAADRASIVGMPSGVAAVLVKSGAVVLELPQDAGTADFDGGFIELPLSTTTLSPNVDPKIVATAQGTVWVTWTEGSSQPQSVYVASSTDGFTPSLVGSGYSSAIALDSQGAPRVIYFGFFGNTGGVFEAFRDGGVWQSSSIDPTGRSGLAVAVDSSGQTHFLYASGTFGEVRHAFRDGGYQYEVIEPAGAKQAFPAVALAAGANGVLHAIWTSGLYGVAYGRLDSNGWEKGAIPQPAANGSSVGVALKDGHPQLALQDRSFGVLAVPFGSADAGFAIQQLNQTSGDWVSIAVDGQGEIWFADENNSPGGLRIWKIGGHYAPGYAQRVKDIATELCNEAAECRGDAGQDQCIAFPPGGKSCLGPEYYCPIGLRDDLWRVDIDAGVVDDCLAALGTATCGDGGTRTAIAPAVCSSLYR
ncbi:MAG: hypothetical protein ACJ790_13160 [Myxococcaceae bacterium]